MGLNMEDDLPVNSLLRQTDVAREVGFLIMYAANIEVWYLEILKIFLRHEAEIAGIIFGNIDSLSAKTDVIFRILEFKKGWLISQELLPMKEAVERAISFRNDVAHGQHGLSQEGNANLTKNFMTFKRGKPKTITVSVEMINAHVQVLRSAIFIMRKYVGADLLVAHHGSIDGRPAALLPDKLVQADQKNRQPRKDRQAPKRRNQPESSQEQA
jgi:hypothetical protein